MEAKTTQVLRQKEFNFENFSHSRTETKNKFDENHLFKIISDGILHVCLNSDLKFINLSEPEARWAITKTLEIELQSEFENFISTHQKTGAFSILLNSLKEKLHLQDQNPISLIQRELKLSLDLVFQGYEERRHFAKNLLAGCHNNYLNEFEKWSRFESFKQVKPVHVDFNPIAVSILLEEKDYELIRPGSCSAGVTIGHADIPSELESRLILIKLSQVYDFDKLKKTKLHEYTHAMQNIFALGPQYLDEHNFYQKLKDNNKLTEVAHYLAFTKSQILPLKYHILSECAAYASEGRIYLRAEALGLGGLVSRTLKFFEPMSDDVKNTEIKSAIFEIFHEYIKSALNFASKMCLLTRTELFNQNSLTVKNSGIFTEIMLKSAEDYGYKLLRNKQNYADDQELMAHAKREGIHAFNKYLDNFNQSLINTPSDQYLSDEARQELDLAIIHTPLSQNQIDYALQILNAKPTCPRITYVAKYLKHELLHASPSEAIVLSAKIDQILESINLEYQIFKDPHLAELIEAQELIQSVRTGQTPIERFLDLINKSEAINSWDFQKFFIYASHNNSFYLHKLQYTKLCESELFKSEPVNLLLILRSNADYGLKVLCLNTLSNLIKINNYDLGDLLLIKRGIAEQSCWTSNEFEKSAYAEALKCLQLTLNDAIILASFKIT
jgi:hypothetical protein